MSPQLSFKSLPWSDGISPPASSLDTLPEPDTAIIARNAPRVQARAAWYTSNTSNQPPSPSAWEPYKPPAEKVSWLKAFVDNVRTKCIRFFRRRKQSAEPSVEPAALHPARMTHQNCPLKPSQTIRKGESDFQMRDDFFARRAERCLECGDFDLAQDEYFRGITACESSSFRGLADMYKRNLVRGNQAKVLESKLLNWKERVKIFLRQESKGAILFEKLVAIADRSRLTPGNDWP